VWSTEPSQCIGIAFPPGCSQRCKCRRISAVWYCMHAFIMDRGRKRTNPSKAYQIEIWPVETNCLQPRPHHVSLKLGAGTVRGRRIIIIRWSGQRPATAVLHHHQARDVAGGRHATLIGRACTFAFDTTAGMMGDALRQYAPRLGSPSTRDAHFPCPGSALNTTLVTPPLLL
jgi:hypothetical protein